MHIHTVLTFDIQLTIACLSDIISEMTAAVKAIVFNKSNLKISEALDNQRILHDIIY